MKTGYSWKFTACAIAWISMWAQRWPMLDAEAITFLGRSPVPRILLRPRGQGVNVIHHHTLSFCKPTSLSVTAKWIKDEPRGPASSLVHVQQVLATKQVVYLGPSMPKLHLVQDVPSSWRLSHWDPCTGHHPHRPRGGLYLTTYREPPGTKEWWLPLGHGKRTDWWWCSGRQQLCASPPDSSKWCNLERWKIKEQLD